MQEVPGGDECGMGVPARQGDRWTSDAGTVLKPCRSLRWGASPAGHGSTGEGTEGGKGSAV